MQVTYIRAVWNSDSGDFVDSYKASVPDPVCNYGPNDKLSHKPTNTVAEVLDILVRRRSWNARPLVHTDVLTRDASVK